MQFTSPQHTNTTPPYSPQPYNQNYPLINSLLQTMTYLQQQVPTLQQNNNSQPLQYIKSTPFSFDILRAKIPQGIEVLHFEKYVGEGDPISHVFTFTAFCSDFVFEDKILARLFPRFLNDTTLEWLSSLLNNSIGSLNELIDAFYNHFYIHFGSQNYPCVFNEMQTKRRWESN